MLELNVHRRSEMLRSVLGVGILKRGGVESVCTLEMRWPGAGRNGIESVSSQARRSNNAMMWFKLNSACEDFDIWLLLLLLL